MLVKEIMSTCIAECTEDMSLERVYHLMQNCGHKVVVVVESKYHRVPIGVVTERTILEQIVGRGRNPKGLRKGARLLRQDVRFAPEAPILCENRTVDAISG